MYRCLCFVLGMAVGVIAGTIRKDDPAIVTKTVTKIVYRDAVICRDCNGTGSVAGLPCPLCGATGTFAASDGRTCQCPLCLGTGKQIGGCSGCNGTGSLWHEHTGK